jgi:hypothetical protein
VKNANKILIIAGTLVVFTVLLYFFGFRSNKMVSDNWDEHYRPEQPSPYGTYVLKELLDTTGLFGNFLEINAQLEDELQDNEEVNDIYFFIGKVNYLKRDASAYLIDFVKKGNTAFISSERFPEGLLDEICYDRDWILRDSVKVDSLAYFKFLHPELEDKRFETKAIYKNKGHERIWYYFNTYAFDDKHIDELKVLGTTVDNDWNFVRIKLGEGYIFLHSTPYQFTNICLTKQEGLLYAENILKHIPPGRVQWDKYNLEFHEQKVEEQERNNKSNGPRRSILEFIMRHPPLYWALFILLVGALLYVVFKGKRMQKVVPATISKENTSLQYIDTLASLYLKERKHNKLIRLKEKTFLNFIADHYYIHTRNVDQKYIEKVAIKSHVPEEKIKEIFTLFKSLERSKNVSDESLIMLHKKIEQFYKICR